MDLNDVNYDELIARAKKIDPINYLDIVHDFILDGGTLKGLKYKYKTVNPSDFSVKIIGSCHTCQKCNTIKPAGCFSIKESKGNKYLNNVCDVCFNEYVSSYFRKRYHSDSEFRRKVLDWQKAYSKTPAGKKNNRRACKKYYEANKEKCNILYKRYRDANRDIINERSRINQAKYAEERKKDPEKYELWLQQKREARKRYNEKKKLEKLKLCQN